MDLDEFKAKENILKDIALELLQKEKECNELRLEHQDLFKELRTQSRFLGLKVIDGEFVLP